MENIKELKENLIERLLQWGMNPKFVEDPSFDSIMRTINGMFSNGSVLNEIPNSNSISISYKDENDNDCDFTVTVQDQNNLYVVSVYRKENKDLNNYYKTKHISESIVKLKDGSLEEVIRNNCRLDTKDCMYGECNNYSSSEKSIYSNGIMMRREFINFSSGKLSSNIDNVSIDSALFNSHISDIYSSMCTDYSILLRDKYDTAFYSYENKKGGIIYQANVPLKNEYGYQEMIIDGNIIKEMPEEIIIEPKSRIIIEDELNKETNQKVREELNKLSIGRENYYYNSKNNSSFRREGFSDNQNVTR